MLREKKDLKIPPKKTYKGTNTKLEQWSKFAQATQMQGKKELWVPTDVDQRPWKEEDLPMRLKVPQSFLLQVSHVVENIQ